MKNKEQLELYKNLNEQNSLRDVQKYVNKINEIRGFNNQEVSKSN